MVCRVDLPIFLQTGAFDRVKCSSWQKKPNQLLLLRYRITDIDLLLDYYPVAFAATVHATIVAETKSLKMTEDNLGNNSDTTNDENTDLGRPDEADEAATIHECYDHDSSQENAAVGRACQPPPQQLDEQEPKHRSETSSTAQEKAVANYLHKRTAGSPFFEANPAPSLPVFDTDGTFQCFVFFFCKRTN